MHIERCYLINLERRPDRLEAFRAGLPDEWPLPSVERCVAVDGRQLTPPDWWTPGPGAWACLQSHFRILDYNLKQGVESYCVFEDDAVFRPEFAQHFRQFLDHLPDDWGLAFLGGEFLRADRFLPVAINDFVCRPYNVNRLHGYMVRGSAAMQRLRDHFERPFWRTGDHADHHLGRLIQRRFQAERLSMPDNRSVPCYAPMKWLVGQRDTTSDILQTAETATGVDCYFSDVSDIGWPQDRFVAVLGLYGSETSTVAMILHHLGVHMGNRLVGFEPAGGGEAAQLAFLCERMMPFPQTSPDWSEQRCLRTVRRWMFARKSEARQRRTVAGAKHATLCAMGSVLAQAAGPGLRVISVERPLEESIQVLAERSRYDPDLQFRASTEECVALQTSLHEQRNRFLQNHPDVAVHHVDYARLRNDPESAVEALVSFLGIHPTDGQLARTIRYVQSEMAIHRCPFPS